MVPLKGSVAWRRPTLTDGREVELNSKILCSWDNFVPFAIVDSQRLITIKQIKFNSIDKVNNWVRLIQIQLFLFTYMHNKNSPAADSYI